MKQYKIRKSNRLKEYDYSAAGYYYVAIMPNHIHGIIIKNSVGTGHALSSNKNAK